MSGSEPKPDRAEKGNTVPSGPDRSEKGSHAVSGAGQAVGVAIAAEPGLFRELLSGLLRADSILRVVGEGQSEDEIGEILRRERPRVLLLDAATIAEGQEGMISRLRRAAAATRILVLAARSGGDEVRQVLHAGAAGLVCKESGSQTLLRAIRAVADGEVWADRQVTARAIEDLAATFGRVPEPERPLTKREKEIADGVARGFRNKEIARRLRITEKTVKSHLHHIFRKLQVDNRFAVGLYTLERGGERRGR
jgi:DNA-binding NarL/FixJ family response regulator